MIKKTVSPLHLHADVLEWRPERFSLTMSSPEAKWFSPTEGSWHPDRKAELVIDTDATGSSKSASRVILRDAPATEDIYMLSHLQSSALHRFHHSFVVAVRANASGDAHTEQHRVVGTVGLVLSWRHAFRVFLVFATEREAAEWYAALQSFSGGQRHGDMDQGRHLAPGETVTCNETDGEIEEVPLAVLQRRVVKQTKPPHNGLLMIQNPNGTFHRWCVIPSKYLVNVADWKTEPSRQVIYLCRCRSRLLLQMKKLVGLTPRRRLDLRYTIISDEKASDTLFVLNYHPPHSNLVLGGQKKKEPHRIQYRRYECIAASVNEKLEWQQWFISCGARALHNYEPSAKATRVGDMCLVESTAYSRMGSSVSTALGRSTLSDRTAVNTAKVQKPRSPSHRRNSSHEVPVNSIRWCSEKTDRSGYLSSSMETPPNKASTCPPSLKETSSEDSTSSPLELPYSEPSPDIERGYEFSTDGNLSYSVEIENKMEKCGPMALQDTFDQCAYGESFEERPCDVPPPLPCRERMEDSIVFRGQTIEGWSASPEMVTPDPPPRSASSYSIDTHLSESQMYTENAGGQRNNKEKPCEDVITSRDDELRQILDELLKPDEEEASEDKRLRQPRGTLFVHGVSDRVDEEQEAIWKSERQAFLSSIQSLHIIETDENIGSAVSL